ncbi:putative porin [Marinirhabdus gelatinilytica]|uniref:Putative beta-barrel porin n=1 Tax=Marinirhabdus gelatinilytica TaxID=1703343 RepID=A0A370Q7H2_9FLAO|nr:putative porin [Marinirhabdus gelatinilytica]RDK84311.1 putative beta-barrel porin [Marinirhabdus gelatinilytica]
MKNRLLFVLLCCVPALAFSQENEADAPNQKKEKPPIELYKIISHDWDTTYVDTTLSIQKEYRFNYLRKDTFELLPFANVGQTYNTLAYDFSRKNFKPLFVAQSHHFNFEQIEDISYYSVPTPLTELYFKTAFEQGQQLDAFFTVNTNEQFNFSISYKGLRSLGLYQQSLASTGNFRFTTNYHTKNKRYRFRGHIVAQDILNEENGGLPATSLALFASDEGDFDDRGRLDVNFENAENKLEGLRFYGDHQYELISQRDSLSHNVLAIGNQISYEDKFYEYRQTAPFNGFGDSYESADLKKETTLEDFNAQAFAKLDNSILGKIGAYVSYTNFNYGYNSVIIFDEGRIPNRLQGDILTAGANYKKQYRGFALEGEGFINVAGDYDATYLKGAASFSFNETNRVEASASIHSSAPNFNFLLYQSDYVNYNWQTNFNNVKTQELNFKLQSEKLLDASVTYTGIDDYTYFTIQPNDSTPTPQQFSERVDYIKVKAEKEFRYKKFALMNTVLFQQAISGGEVLNVPEIVTRQSLYYQDEWFKKAAFIQTGITFKYFTEYTMNAYDPVLAEFYVQNDQKLGGFPLVDVFFNAKIRQTRIYFKYEHINQLFNSTNNHFSAPTYPYRDAVIRFGLVWNFFL